MMLVQNILGAEPRYELYHSGANNSYQRNSYTYQIVKNSALFSEKIMLASILDPEIIGKIAATGNRGWGPRQVIISMLPNNRADTILYILVVTS